MQQNGESLSADMHSSPTQPKTAHTIVLPPPPRPLGRAGIEQKLGIASPSRDYPVHFGAVDVNALGIPGRQIAAPLCENVQFVRDILDSIVKTVVHAEGLEKAPWDVAAAADRSPKERHIQLPEISGLTEAADGQLVHYVERSFAMQANSFE